MARPTKAIIDLAALQHNYSLAQSLSGAGRAMPIIKANAYGHGLVAVARALASQAPAFGVACIEEALELREAGISQPILLLQGAFADDEIVTAEQNNFWLMVSSQQQADAIVRAPILGVITAWLKVDTGMKRLGVSPGDTKSIYQQLHGSSNVAPEIVLATHFACADDLDDSSTSRQLHLFNEAVAGIHAPRSMANSAALLAWEKTRGEWNRPGFMLYGNTPVTCEDCQSVADQLKPVMTLRSEIIALRNVSKGEAVGYGGAWRAERDSRIATVSIGYGDGYPRHAVNGTPVLVNGQRVPLAGRVSMDMITVDVTDLDAVAVGDPVVLWGEGLSVNEVAEYAGTIGYELLTLVSQRTPRVYIGSSEF